MKLSPFFALLCAAALARPAAAQSLDGRVVKDGRPVADVSIELHRVTGDGGRVVGGARTGPSGAFSIPLPAASDTGFAVVFATATADGVRYFGRALHPGETPAGYEIAVFDTTSAAPAADSVRITRRDVFLIPQLDGGWEVAEVLRLRNPGRRTIVAAGEKPAVGLALPRGVGEFEAGNASADSVRPSGVMQVGDRVWITEPIVPGERELFFRYVLAARSRTLPLPLGRPTDTLQVYVRQPAPQVKVAGLAAEGVMEAEGESFLRFGGTGLAAAREVTLTARAASASPVDPRWAALAVAGVILAAGVALALRRGRRPAPG